MSKFPVLIAAQAHYIAAESDPDRQKFIWSYEITITNEGSEILQLLNRCWLITDMNGKIEKVHGAGVIGLQPIIKPGKPFVYTSFCQLMTPQGTMEGFYEMQTLEEEHFNADIPKFILSTPTTMSKRYQSRLH